MVFDLPVLAISVLSLLPCMLERSGLSVSRTVYGHIHNCPL